MLNTQPLNNLWKPDLREHVLPQDWAAKSGRSPSVPKLDVRKLYKAFPIQGKTLTVLQNINLQLFPREFVCLVGTSGCGKSTLLNIIAGLMAPSAGQVLVNGDGVVGLGSDRGMLFQGYTLYPWLTVAENIAFELELRKLPKAEQQERVAYYLDMVGLTEFAEVYPKQLSGGMKQRVAIAHVLATEPDLLLMDDPFGVLDAQTKEHMQQFLIDLWERTRTTILMITRDVEEAIFLSQRVYAMSSHPGRITQEVAIALPEQRDLSMKRSPEFVELKRDMIHTLQAEEK